MTKKREIIFLLIILLIASFFRVWQLNTIPPGLYPDVAINGNEAISNPGKIFYPENNGREGLFINLIALSFSIFGISIWSIRIVSAIIGILTILGLYLLTKELFSQYYETTTRPPRPPTSWAPRSRSIALLASFFLATSFWHVNFSRIGFRAILVPLVLTFAFYFLLKGFRTQKVSNFIFAGIIFGLGFYTYIAFRLAVVLLAVILVLWWLVYKQRGLQKKYLFFIFYFLFFIFITALPIGLYFLQNPHNFVGRAAPISVFATENPLKEFGKSLILHLGMFNFSGDFNWRHNISGSPVLFWPIGILFLIGLAVSIKEIISKKLSAISHWELVSWFFIMLLPGILTYESIPHSLRCIGVIPAVFIFSALGFEFLYLKTKEKIKIRKNSLSYWLIISVLTLLFLLFIFAEYSRYFILWAQNPEVENAFSKNYVEIGNYLNSLGPETQKYLIVKQVGIPVPYPDGIPMPAQTPMFIERTKFKEPRSIYLLPENLDEIKIKRNGVIVLMKYDENLIFELWQKFPNGEIQEKNGVWVFKI